jgi:hypothetical protein
MLSLKIFLLACVGVCLSQPLNKEQLLNQLAYDFDKGERMLLNFLSMERELQQDEAALNEMLNDMQKAMPFMAAAAAHHSDGDNIRMTRRRKRNSAAIRT